MGKLSADLAAIDTFQEFENVAQLHALVGRTGKSARVEFEVHVGLGQSEVALFEYARDRPLHQTKRIDVRDLVTTKAVNLDQPRDSSLLCPRRYRLAARSPGNCSRLATVACLFEQFFPNLRVRNLGVGVAHRLEIIAPSGRHGIGTLEVLLVQCLDSARVAAEQRR